ncbi:MAG: trypsin-like peptidase domain-containing protein [Cyanobacteria bacterium P01_C01_bin.89]
MDLRTTITLVSSGFDPLVFGTGFVIYADETRSYLVTCAHVVRDIRDAQKRSDAPDDILVNGVNADVVAIGAPNTIDLAVLSVPRLSKLSTLPLSKSAKTGAAVTVDGQYTLEKKSAQIAQRLHGKLGREIVLTSQSSQERGWWLEFQEGDRIQAGYSGGPVVCDGRVIAVAAIRDGDGGKAIAIAIEAVATIWAEMPKSLLVSETVAPEPSLPDTVTSDLPSTSTVAMDWNKDRKKEFRKALQEVYPNYEELQVFVTSELGENLPNITGNRNLKIACFELVEWGCARGRVDELFAAFVADNPRHPLAGGTASTADSSSSNVGASSVVQRLERERLDKKLAMLTKQYQSVADQLNTELNPVTRPILEQQLGQVATQIAEVEEKLKGL